MAEYTKHVQMGVVDANGDVYVIYPQSYAANIIVQTGNSGYLYDNSLSDVQAALAKIGSDIADLQNAGGGAFYGTCSSAASDATKVVTCADFTADKLVAGTQIAIKFTNDNTSDTVELNINNTGVKSVVRYGTATSGFGSGTWISGQTMLFTFDGTYWSITGAANRYATTSVYGLTLLSSAIDSSSESIAATSAAVKSAYDRAGRKAPIAHAAADLTYGGGTASNYGHVKVSDSYTSSAGAAASSIAASSKAVYDAYTALVAKFTDGSVTKVGTANMGGSYTPVYLAAGVPTEGSECAPKSHASTSSTYGKGSTSNYGHVKISDNYTSSAGAASAAVAASSKAVYDVYNYALNRITYGTSDMTAGTSALTTGNVYLVYE